MQFLHSMSMVLPAWPLLVLLHIPLVWAGPLSTESLTPSLAGVIPTCARTCVESFITENYKTVCGPPPNFDCLCVNITPSGFTIGEGSLECLVSSCENFTETQAVKIYDACVGVPDARPNTHAVLTAIATSAVSRTIGTGVPTRSDASSFSTTPYIPPSLPSETASITPSESNSATTTTTSQSSVRSSVSSTKTLTSAPLITPTSSLTSSSIPTRTTSAAVSSAAALASAQVLTKPQIAGIAVASIGSTAIALGLCFVLIFFRKKRSRKRSQKRYSASSFGGSKVMDSSLDSTPDLAAHSTGEFGRHVQSREESPPPVPRAPLRLVTPATSSEDGWDHYQRSMETEDIGLAIGPAVRNMTAGPSPKSPRSNRTTNSHLLPDKPTYTLFPSPLKINARHSIPVQSVRPSGVDTSNSARPPSTGPIHQFPNIMDNTSQSNLQGRTNVHRSISRSDPFYDSSSPPLIDPSIQKHDPNVHPVFRIPQQLSPTKGALKPVPEYQSPSARRLLPSTSRAMQPQLARNHPVPSPVEQHHRDSIDSHWRRKHHANRKSESSKPLNQETFFSEESDTTSIEEDSEDELEHRDMRPQSTLSPVAESPRLRSPFQPQQPDFQYPPVPVSTSVSPMRYPTGPEQQFQPQPLSSRRLGEQRAREITGRLETRAQPSAKWKVLVSPGLEPLGNSESPSSPSRSEADRTRSR